MLKGIKRMGLLGFAFIAMAIPLGIRPAFAIPVNTELLLLVDVSGSISNTEFNLQRTGYANAFQNVAVQNLIGINPGGIAVSMVYWSNNNQQLQAVGWTHLTDAASANAFATSISNAPRPYNNNTAVQAALNYGGSLFTNNGFEGTNLIIDISGDGVDNNSSPTSFRLGGGRANALAAGVDTINGLVIGGDPAVTTYYNNYVLGGGGVLFAASTFADFANAVQQKIFYEVGCIEGCGTSGGTTTSGSTTSGSSSGCIVECGTSSGSSTGEPPQVPEPATLLLMGSGLSVLALFRRRKP